MNTNLRNALVITTTTGIGLFGNILSYSLKYPNQNIKKFHFMFPKGLEMFYVLATGVVAGLAINKSLSLIENAFKTKEEILFDNLISEEKQKIKKGIVKNKKPTQVLWT